MKLLEALLGEKMKLGVQEAVIQKEYSFTRIQVDVEIVIKGIKSNCTNLILNMPYTQLQRLSNV